MMKIKIALILLTVLLLGTFIRANAISPYKFYPDSYVALVVAENISEYGSAVGTLGKEGMIYPDFFGWTRPLYPLLINIFNTFVDNSETTARALSLIFGLGAIPLAYLLISRALESKRSGLLGAVLLTLSYNHTIWSGFILSDTAGVFFLLLTLWLLFRSLYLKYELADWHDLLTGAVFAIAILTRYEYAVLIIPLVFLVYHKSPQPTTRLISMAAVVSIIFGLTYFFLSPFSIDNTTTLSQLGSFASSLGALDLSGIQRFVVSDFVLAIFSIVGIFLMLRHRTHRGQAYFVLLALALLGSMYYQTNPAMIRYFTHLIPFLLLPASFGLGKVIEWAYLQRPMKRYLAISICMFLLVVQGYVSYRGLHEEKNGIWFMEGYEVRAAELVSDRLPRDAFTIVSFPEPYFLTTKHDTYSIADKAPFIYISDTLNARTAIIIEDEGMREIFPVFTDFLQKSMGKYKMAEIPLDTPFRYADRVEEVEEPIYLYKIELSDLREIIKVYEINNPNPLL